MTDVEQKEQEVKEKTSETDSSQGNAKENGEGEKPDTPGSEGKVEKKESESSDEETLEVELKGIEKQEDGTYAFNFGGSTYHGKTPQEAIEKAEEGVKAKNQSYQKTQEELKKLKTQTSIREPREEEEEAEIPPAPNQDEFLRQVFAQKNLDPKMLSYTDKDWDEYQEEKGLKDRHIVRLQNDVDTAKQEALRQYYAEETRWYNLSLLRKEITPAVREMVADSGLEPDEFGEAYAQLLKDPNMRFKNGELNSTAILRAMSKKIVEKLKAEGTSTSELQKEKKRLEEELRERKKELEGGGSRTNQKSQKPQPKVTNLKDAFDQMPDFLNSLS